MSHQVGRSGSLKQGVLEGGACAAGGRGVPSVGCQGLRVAARDVGGLVRSFCRQMYMLWSVYGWEGDMGSTRSLGSCIL